MTGFQAFVVNAYQTAWLLGLIIAFTAFMLLILTFRPSDSGFIRWLRRQRYWLFTIFVFGFLLDLPH